MRYLRGIALMFAVQLLWSGCSGEADSAPAEEFYNLGEADQGEIEDVFTSVELTPLEFAGEYYPVQVKRVKVADGYIFVEDIKSNLYMFDSNGKYLSCSASMRGQGPGEFAVVMDIDWNPFEKTLEVLTPSKLMRYDINMNYIDEKTLPTKIPENKKDVFLLGDLDVLSPSQRLMSPTAFCKNPGRLCVYDVEQQEIVDEIDFSDDIIAYGTMQYDVAQRQPDGTILCTPALQTQLVYELDTAQIKLNKKIEYTLGSKGLSKQDIENVSGTPEKQSEFLMNSESHIPIRTLVCSDRMLTLVKFGNGLRKFYTVVTDRRTGDMKAVNFFDGNERTFPMIECIDSAYAYAVAEKEVLMGSPRLLLDKSADVDSIDEAIEDESLVLLKYKFK